MADEARTEAGRDWWPLAIRWATRGAVPARPSVVARPGDTAQVAAVLAACHEARVPVTAMAGRSGVCGASVPVFGGVALDMCAVNGIVDIDSPSLLAEVLPGTFGPDLEAGLRAEGVTLGHWPQSMDLSTVGGWLACRGAGQYSTRYGKIEDMVVGLEVVLADGRVVRTGGTGPRAATGPDLTQMFVGSEGVLGVITSCLLRLHPLATAERRRAYGFASFAEGLEACRLILRRGATPAVLRLYDHAESARNFDVADHCVLVVLDEADPGLLDATMAVVEAECARGSGHPARRRPGRTVDDPPQRRLGPGPALPRRHRGGHDRDRRPLGGAAVDLPGVCRRPRSASRGRWRFGPPVARLWRRGLPVLHLRRPHARHGRRCRRRTGLRTRGPRSTTDRPGAP